MATKKDKVESTEEVDTSSEKTVMGKNSDGETVEVYEPDRGTQDAPAVSQADNDVDKKPAAKLASGADQHVSNVRKAAISADGESNGVKVAGGASDPEDTIEATEAAEKLAKENGIDLSTLIGSGAGGNITKADVEKAIAEKAAS